MLLLNCKEKEKITISYRRFIFASVRNEPAVICRLIVVVIFDNTEKEDLKMEWISVKDELPKDDGEFLVCLYGDVTVKEFNPWTSGNDENSFVWFEWENIPGYGSQKSQVLGVTHWMSLPKPPEVI